MKRKFILFILGIIILLGTCGCTTQDELGNSNITTTVYPIEYLVSRLYGEKESSNIVSIYPNDTKINDYSLTDKQLKDYAKSSAIFIYNGLTNEKEIAKTLVNKNRKIQLVDVSYGLKYSYGIEELWLHPNNYLMLANTIKEDLVELSSSKYVADEIENNYSKLEEDLALLDADFRALGKNAKNNNKETIVTANSTFGFLNDYGFNVIDISEENNVTTSIKNKFKDKTYKYIIVNDIKNIPDHIKDLVDNYGVELVEINTMETLSETERSNNDNYLTIMKEFINKLSNIVLK